MGSWAEYRERVEDMGNWSFRGQADENWPLWTTLSRYLINFRVPRDMWEMREYRILRTFKRKAHLFLKDVPDHRDEYQWLALMQHHGAPTRLLDITYSPFVAAFFALERSQGQAVVWCFDMHRLKYKSRVKVKRPTNKRATFRPIRDLSPKASADGHGQLVAEAQSNYLDYFLDGDAPFVFLGRPHVMNQRLIAQNALFALPSMLDTSVDEILRNNNEWAPGLLKLILPTDAIRSDAMREMFNMNLSNATIFPGLDGLAKSMAYELEFETTLERAIAEAKS